MARKRYKPEEIVARLRQVDVLLSQGQSTVDAVRQIGVTETTYFRWRREYGGLKTDQVKRLKDLEDRRSRCAVRPVPAARRARAYSVGQWPRIRCCVGAPRDWRSWGEHRLHRTGQSLGERLHRELQCPSAGRAARRRDLLLGQGGADHHREQAAPLQRRATSRIPRLPPSCSGGSHPGQQRMTGCARVKPAMLPLASNVGVY